ncbi:hypothetical protein RSOLAG22IIIB_13210 [Rhizoctonia solani]|uniref:Uncharacterized protein n=1 Tax=Rhizoctonia solani TaxID=456999 RepID=A0A0K6GIV8_9AGAM|nr:hypothetical protein RSOLAG22IIIB_13210 [Rhizoctonia solani]
MNLTDKAEGLPMEHEEAPLSCIPTPAPDANSVAPMMCSPTAQLGADTGSDYLDDPDNDGELDLPPWLMRDCCNPCKERGQTSKCNKHWPTCAKWIACGTEERCFEGATNLDAIQHATRGLAPNAAAPRTPTMHRAASATPVLQNTHANQLCRTLNLCQIPNAPAPARVDRRSQSPPRQPAPRDSRRARSPPAPEQQPDFDTLARLEQRSAFLEEELIRTKALLATHVAGSNHVAPLLGFSSGQFQPPIDSLNHHDDTERLRLGSDGTLEQSSVRKLDSGADKLLTDVQWDHAWLRCLEFYQSINYPKLGNWQVHYQMIKREPDYCKAFEKWREYNIRVCHCVFNEGIDPKTMQWGILAKISMEYDRAQYKAYILTTVNQEVARQVEIKHARFPPPTISHSTCQSNNATNMQPVSTPSARPDKPHRAPSRFLSSSKVC